METLVLVALASVIGAGLNTVRGYLHSSKPYDVKKLAGSVIVASMTALGLSSTIVVDGLSQAGVVLIGLVTGFVADYAVTKAKK